MRVFLPKQCLQDGDGLLLGCTDQQATFCCITALLPFPVASKYLLTVLPNTTAHSTTFGFVGLLENGKRHHDADLRDLPIPPLLRIRNCDGRLSVKQYSAGTGSHPPSQNPVENFIVIVYDAARFCRSVFMDCKSEDLTLAADGLSNVALIKYSFSYSRKYLMPMLNSKMNAIDYTSAVSKSYFAIASSFLFSIAFRLVSLLLTVANGVASFSLLQSPVIQMIVSLPATFNHIKSKLTVLSSHSLSASSSRKCRIGFISFLWLHALDVCAGLCLMVYLLYDDKAAAIAQNLLSTAEAVALELETLLNWMMGVPAGLKLNQPLAQFLGKFFLYHIFLWKAYLHALEPFAGTVLSCACVTGCLGFSVQLAVIQDVLSMMTLHIYCFYVYAARLYNLQVYALSSLWRLFRGKKWNVLRKRVDSAVYDIDQLFLGTLLFTILLFLLPTTALFYAVFALLRVVVLAGQGLVMKAMTIISSLPIFWLMLRLFQPAAISGNVSITVLQQHSSLCLALELKPVSVADLFSADRNIEASKITLPSADDDNTWKSLIHKLLRGQLIYPWIPSSPQP